MSHVSLSVMETELGKLQKTSLFELITKKTFQHYQIHHHQPINVPTAGAQTFLMDYT
jgi:hypothetical protein